jgi:pimeloyl-ACP methyl ester carboxylesterase
MLHYLGRTVVCMSGWPGRTRLVARGDDVVPDLPPQRRVKFADGQSLVVRHASGPTPVLLLHGWAITADLNFCHLMAPLADRHGVVAMDVRGHGRGLPLPPGERFNLAQCADDAAAVLDRLGIDRVVVCGYSLGGPVGLEFARRHRDRVAGLVLQATALSFDSPTDKLGRLLFRGLRPLADYSGALGRSAPLLYFIPVRARSPQTAALWPWLRSEIGMCHPRVIVDVILAEYDFDFRPHLLSIAGLPTVVVVTSGDGVVPPKDQWELAARLDAEVIELNAGHNVFLTDPDAYVAATLDAVGRAWGGE